MRVDYNLIGYKLVIYLYIKIKKKIEYKNYENMRKRDRVRDRKKLLWNYI